MCLRPAYTPIYPHVNIRAGQPLVFVQNFGVRLLRTISHLRSLCIWYEHGVGYVRCPLLTNSHRVHTLQHFRSGMSSLHLQLVSTVFPSLHEVIADGTTFSELTQRIKPTRRSTNRIRTYIDDANSFLVCLRLHTCPSTSNDYSSSYRVQLWSVTLLYNLLLVSTTCGNLLMQY